MNTVQIVSTEVLSDHWYTLRKVTFDYIRKDGSSQRQSRECYDRGNGAVILLYNGEKNTVILTRQFRMPTYVNGNKDGMLIEACAGLLDADSPEDCIRRETEEETGYRITKPERVFELYMSPGSVTEILYFFIAEYQEAHKMNEGGGVEAEEDIQVLELSFPQALKMIDTGEIKDAKTVLLLQHLQLKDRMKA
ncbi:GDP-mannose pyrophosphatase NudK [Siphonobacter sp. SORGH_AS_1065]|uniref:GDP-mannose pyrophosphatase NudK n=1 Tax=Siphonobacter sp. SORGH_AS_1065 TaxID=3041795 RepID=UPI002782E14F|nr:GDP-mannose pyrophosphatase NudK [Siphonobacter sp. SORGH_AS_1065]MDQ1087687.1 GDP-mannose pyrophosphatase NudK [Siphonobacter sp. SORGH_AS_1065]